MSDHPQTAKPLVNPDALRDAIQDKLEKRRQKPPFTHFTVDSPVFADGVWRSIVHHDKSSPVDYATVLAEVEEELFDDFGVNVALVLASD